MYVTCHPRTSQQLWKDSCLSSLSSFLETLKRYEKTAVCEACCVRPPSLPPTPLKVKFSSLSYASLTKSVLCRSRGSSKLLVYACRLRCYWVSMICFKLRYEIRKIQKFSKTVLIIHQNLQISWKIVQLSRYNFDFKGTDVLVFAVVFQFQSICHSSQHN